MDATPCLIPHHDLAQRPPLGWNSFICYGAAVTEDQYKANVDFIAEKLKTAGYQYCVVDFCWSHPSPGSVENPNQEPGFQPSLHCDEWGRLTPAPNRFPSAADGQGFKPLADYTHSKGLKFGIHIMRGMPKEAVDRNCPIKGADATAGQIANRQGGCTWLNHMYGVDMSQEGAQEYYDSLFELYASWEVDYIKADDILVDYPGPYRKAEIEGIRQAIRNCGRPMVLSLSPGPAPISEGQHLMENANMWRISGDFWDRWRNLKAQFPLCNAWSPFIGPGNWPDADMIPIGRLSIGDHHGPERHSFFTTDEKKTLMSLWAMFRSPLMLGADLPTSRDEDIAIIANESVLRVNQRSSNNRQLFRFGEHVGWLADDEDSSDKYLALFNLGDEGDTVSVTLEETGFPQGAYFKDLWTQESLGRKEGVYSVTLPPHGSILIRLSH